MTVLSPTAVAAAARAGGFPDSQVWMAVAVAFTESSGNPDATNHNKDGSTDFGLWQINSVHHPGADWADPAANARMAFKVWSDAGNSWKPWVAFTSGAYKLKGAPSADKSGYGAPLTPDAKPLPLTPDSPAWQAPTIPGADAVTSFISKLGDPSLWKRVGIVALGLLFVIFGLATLLRTELTKAATTVVKDVIT